MIYDNMWSHDDIYKEEWKKLQLYHVASIHMVVRDHTSGVTGPGTWVCEWGLNKKGEWEEVDYRDAPASKKYQLNYHKNKRL